jgi:hypothetical protein
MTEKMLITKKIEDCREYVSMAEKSASVGAYGDSSFYWKRAASLAIGLLDDNSHASFLEEEYKFLKYITEHFNEKDEN